MKQHRFDKAFQEIMESVNEVVHSPDNIYTESAKIKRTMRFAGGGIDLNWEKPLSRNDANNLKGTLDWMYKIARTDLEKAGYPKPQDYVGDIELTYSDDAVYADATLKSFKDSGDEKKFKKMKFKEVK